VILVVNGTMRAVDEEATVEDLIVELGLPRKGAGIAVAVNGEVVHRSKWSRALGEQDRIEILHAVQGG
jgi:thiamine biosynthesis protein ThiS